MPSWKRWLVLAAVACIAIAAPAAGRWWYERHPAGPVVRWIPFVALAVLALAIVGFAVRWDRAALGLTWKPAPSVGFWLRVGLVTGAVILAIALATLAVVRGGGPDPFDLGGQLPICSSLSRRVEMLMLAPLFEELLYRGALCTALMGVGGRALAVAGGGLAFAWLHWFGGVLGPDNLLAGFLFSWAFVRSRTLLVPVAFHCFGNLAVIVLNDAGLLGPCVPLP